MATAFLANVDGDVGFVTTLHSATGCGNAAAINLSSRVVGLRIRKVDVARDVAFLTVPGPALQPGLQTSQDFGSGPLRVIGYPQGMPGQYTIFAQIGQPALRVLGDLLPDDIRLALNRRASPDPAQQVLSLNANIQPGHSGAPVLTSRGEVVAVANGGLRSGFVGIGWAIPYGTIRWEEATRSDIAARVAQLSSAVTPNLFSTEPEPPPTKATPLYFTQAFEPVGRIYKFENGAVTEVYRRTSGAIHSIAISRSGTIYFCDANDRHVFSLDSGREQTVFSHTTYVRDVAVDLRDRLYFSESSGAARDGTIFSYNGSIASPYYTVKLEEVDGFWAGHFNFDPQGALWLSTGNRVPASLYKVVGRVPEAVFTSPGSISGFAFLASDTLLYSDFQHAIVRLTLPGYRADEVYTSALDERLADVQPLRR